MEIIWIVCGKCITVELTVVDVRLGGTIQISAKIVYDRNVVLKTVGIIYGLYNQAYGLPRKH